MFKKSPPLSSLSFPISVMWYLVWSHLSNSTLRYLLDKKVEQFYLLVYLTLNAKGLAASPANLLIFAEASLHFQV